MYRVPRATYRLQFNAAFTFADAAKIVPYLVQLGISDVYASPILKARKGSSHGYDVVDANELNPELGNDDDFNALHEELKSRDMGLLLDVVPNHMAAGDENVWWMSVLESGQRSRYFNYFDLDLTPANTPSITDGQNAHKIMLPILGRPYGEALREREIQLHFDLDGFHFTYFDRRLPSAPASYEGILRECVALLPDVGVGVELRDLLANNLPERNIKLAKEKLWHFYEDETFRDVLDAVIERINNGDDASLEALDALLESQAYRLAYWFPARQRINYRRFFDVTDLVGLRVEDLEVFEAHHRRTLELIAEGKVSGLRIDHIDGLNDPIAYLRRLQQRLGADATRSDHNAFYVILEKILAEREALPRAFAASGTTGYDFLDSVNALFIDSAGLQTLDRFYRDFTGVTESFDRIAYERKKQIVQELFSGEMLSLAKRLGAIAMSGRDGRDFALPDLTAALTEVTVCMGNYRTYIRKGEISESDEKTIRSAVSCAGHSAVPLDPRLFDFLERVLLGKLPPYIEEKRKEWLDFVMRWQQFTGRVMAKGVEDTAFYNYNRLISLNEVGGDPGGAGVSDPLAEFHAHNARIQRDWPHTINATATHDTKRSEDARARINVLAEIAPQWERKVRRWSRMNAPFRTDGVPHPNEELLIYQTLIGMWPLDESEVSTVPERLKQYLEKAAREAKTHTSWIAPNAAYEESLLGFADAILENEPFRNDFSRFQKRIAFYGFLNSLSQIVLKVTSPGEPDFYQGTELWDFSLVDPDNRRPVDYAQRSSMLRRIKSVPNLGTLLRRWKDGRIKMFLTWKLLELRARHADLFRDGTYEPIDAGPNAVAFIRRHGGDAVLIAVPRLVANLVKPGKLPIGEVWGDATLSASGIWRNLCTSEEHEGGAIALSRLFATFPAAVLEKA
jgi:(1->4)-alpha-D-glucan 1-alpha-D-glucosylmutase